MAKIFSSAIVSAIVGSAAATVTCVIFYYFFLKPAQPVDAKPPQAPTQIPATPPVDEIPNPEINPADVSSVGIKTIYKGYFEPGTKCAKTYNEFFGDNDGVFSPSSPCTIMITFDRIGTASRSIEIRRWDKAAKEYRVIERTAAKANITSEQFKNLAQTIVTNDAFRSWREGTMITVSNCSIEVVHTGGIKTVMSNVDEKTTVYLQMVDALKRLEKELHWDPVS